MWAFSIPCPNPTCSDTTSGAVNIFYNPSDNPAGSAVNLGSYTNPTNFSDNVTGGGTLTAYMLVNTLNDLQNIQTDSAFFTDHKWDDIETCLSRFSSLLSEKLNRSGRDLKAAVRAYNGAGPAADLYVQKVMQMRDWCVTA